MYSQKDLENNIEANCGRNYQQCSMSVLDTISDPKITFDENGICNYYQEYKEAHDSTVLTGQKGLDKLAQDFDKIKKDKGSKQYDSILGLSGGVDSTYLCLLAKQNGLNPLVVHCDNGWNSELAQHNIEKTVQICGFDLFTYVIDWNEFRDLQLAYLRASVVDIEVLTDHAFMAVLYEQARKWKIKYVLAGMNVVTEQVLPANWIYDKSDTANIRDIHKKFGDMPSSRIKTFPFLDYDTKKYCTDVLKMEVVTPLNYIPYKYENIKEIITKELEWRDYGGKHYESVWTRFYQGYILPNKFHIDKRKAHLSNLIFSKQISKEIAEAVLRTPPLPENVLRDDLEFVIKKLGLTQDEFSKIMSMPRREHSEFAVQKGFWDRYPMLKFLRPLYAMMHR